jgi:hypothetical protein
MKHRDAKSNCTSYSSELEKNKNKLTAMINLNKKLKEQLSSIENNQTI